MKKTLFKLARVLFVVLVIINVSCDKDEVALSNDNFITSINVLSGDYEKTLEVTGDKVEGVVPYYIDEDDVKINVEFSEKASINPDPKNIKSIKDPIQFIVTAENGVEKKYVVHIRRELSSENAILSFLIKTDSFEVEGVINDQNNTINKRLHPISDLTKITPVVVVSDRATIDPDPSTISDFSSPVTFTVTAENGDLKKYTVNLGIMEEDFSIKCDIRNATKWFGGDDREDSILTPNFAPRNVGTGQAVFLYKDTYPTKFSFFLRDSFKSHETNNVYTGNFQLRLHVRNQDGTIEKMVTTTVIGPFNGGWIDFDLSALDLLFKSETRYYFTWYLVNGEELGVASGSSGNVNIDSGVCSAIGLTGTSRKIENNTLEDWDVWHFHTWHFNFKLEGKQ